jgi:hypothetical protein
MFHGLLNRKNKFPAGGKAARRRRAKNGVEIGLHGGGRVFEFIWESQPSGSGWFSRHSGAGGLDSVLTDAMSSPPNGFSSACSVSLDGGSMGPQSRCAAGRFEPTRHRLPGAHERMPGVKRFAESSRPKLEQTVSDQSAALASAQSAAPAVLTAANPAQTKIPISSDIPGFIATFFGHGLNHQNCLAFGLPISPRFFQLSNSYHYFSPLARRIQPKRPAPPRPLLSIQTPKRTDPIEFIVHRHVAYRENRMTGRVIQSSLPTALTLAVPETTSGLFPHPHG